MQHLVIYRHSRDFVPSSEFEVLIPHLYQMFPNALFAQFMREEQLVISSKSEFKDCDEIARSFTTHDFEESLQKSAANVMIDWNRLVVRLKDFDTLFELKFPVMNDIN